VAIENNKPECIAAVNAKLAEDPFRELSLVKVRTKYPQGGEKQLIKAVTRREVPSGGLPMDAGCVVHNVGTAFAVWDAVVNGTPLYQRVVTVAGPTVKRPKNLLVRVGTPVRALLAACDTDLAATARVVMGGPMMGTALSGLDFPVVKTTSGVLAFDRYAPTAPGVECIGCGDCVKACPIRLVPSALARFVHAEKLDQADSWGVLDCIECGCCSYVCPAKIDLVHYMKLGKYHVQAAKKRSAEKADG
jgi:electron transport complex protein RnfC